MLFSSESNSLKSLGPLNESSLSAIDLLTLGRKYPDFVDCLALVLCL